ncbi:MAG: hypothetical protein G01um10147_945 [Microgenomates group bacterium Gr01-1014_7]|nr:MAG: hypothetical protein G01um10147_945 [Microgenomates group bacterium Gr01-1014_7]
METKKLPVSQTYYQVQALLVNPQIQNALLVINSAQMSKVIKQEIQDTLAGFGFNHLNSDILNSLIRFVKTKDSNLAYLRNVVKIKTLKNEETGEEEIWIRINPYAKKDDLEKVWRQVEEFQKQLPKYVEREREWETFKRDVEIFWKANRYRRRLVKKGIKRTTKTYEEFYPIIEEKYNQYISSQLAAGGNGRIG